MSLDATIEALARHPVFAILDREALRILAFSADKLEVPAGSRLFTQGAAAESAYLVLAGTLEMETSSGGRVMGHGPVPEGALVGELALFCPTVRSANAVARSDLTVLKVGRSMFRRLLEEYPAGAAELRRRMAERLTQLTSALDGLRPILLDGLPDPGETV
jgi:CRP-like cAMP-binding protein